MALNRTAFSVSGATLSVLTGSGAGDFIVTSGSASGPAEFLYATEDGAIAGFNRHVNPLNAVLAVDNAAPWRLRSPSIRDRRAARLGSPGSGSPCASTYGLMVGTLVKSFRYCAVSLASVPLPFSVASALFTHVTS